MTRPRTSVPLHVELIESAEGTWGFTWAMEGAGGAGAGGLDAQTAMLKCYQTVRKELRRLLEPKEVKAARLDKARAVAALRKAKEKGLI